MNFVAKNSFDTICAHHDLISVCTVPNGRRPIENSTLEPTQSTTTTTEPIVTVNNETALIFAASNRFSYSVYNELAKDYDNHLFCSLGLHIALGLFLMGARGRTASQLFDGLKLYNPDHDVLKHAYQDAINLQKDDSESWQIHYTLGTKIGLKINDKFKRDAQEFFSLDIRSINFTNPNVIEKLMHANFWHTNNESLVKVFKDLFTESTVMILVSAVNFTAEWKIPFEITYEDFFYGSVSSQLPIKMMEVTHAFEYKDDPDMNAQILRMDFSNYEGSFHATFSMVIILPYTVDGLRSLEDKLLNTDLHTILSDMKANPIKVKLPEFMIVKITKFREILSKLGIVELFTKDADLTGIVSDGGLWLSEAVHNTFIRVNPQGCNTKSDTVGVGVGAEKIRQNASIPAFNAVHPFYFMIVNRKLNAILFNGRLVDPYEYKIP